MNEIQLNIVEGGITRIRNAAIRINKTIYLVGSRAAGTHTALSDFDYIIPTIRNKEWKKIKNSLPGAKILADNVQNRIDLLKTEIDTNRPYFKIMP
jgi:predicted nucleotidyltransferase